MKVWDADVISYNGEAEPGTIFDVTKDAILVAAGENALALKEIQLAGKKRMQVQAFLLGSSVEKGTRLGD